jgi:hypothetical protein
LLPNFEKLQKLRQSEHRSGKANRKGMSKRPEKKEMKNDQGLRKLEKSTTLDSLIKKDKKLELDQSLFPEEPFVGGDAY